MFKEYFLLLLLGHVLGDFYAQTSKIAEKKEYSFKWVVVHGILYLLTVMGVCIPFLSVEILVMALLASFLHLLVDTLKYLYLRKKRKIVSKIFVLDQCVHLICLIGIAYFWTMKNIRVQELKIVADFFDTIQVSEVLLGRWMVGLLLVHKPANVLIQNLIGTYKPQSINNEFKADNNIGRVIGSVERVIMLILLYMNQYSAIGLVLTAKSIARYDRIAKDEKFAEYYLLGTLISAGIVIICAVLLFG